MIEIPYADFVAKLSEQTAHSERTSPPLISSHELYQKPDIHPTFLF